MVSGIPPVGMTQNEHFLSCDTVLLGVQCILCGYVLATSSDHPLHSCADSGTIKI
jgi:hypothetical protein